MMEDEDPAQAEEAEVREAEEAEAMEAPGETEAKSPAPVRLTEAQWAEIVERAELGTSKSSELAREFGVSPQAVSNYFKKHGVVAGSRKHEIASKIGTALGVAKAAEVVTFEHKRKQRIEETKTDHYNWMSAIQRQIMSKVANAVKAGDPIASIDADMRTLYRVLKSLEIGRRERYKLLDVEGLVDETTLPQIQIRDLTEEEIESFRSASSEDDDLLDDDDIVVEGDDE